MKNKSTNRRRSLLVSAAVIVLCMVVVVGMTYALFTDTQKVQNHLKAGDLRITLKRTELTKTTLNENGYLVTPDVPDKTVVDFTNPTDKNVFGLNTDGNGEVTEKIVPGSKFVAKMEIQNNSDVAFGYWIEIICTDKTRGEDLAKQLKITVDAKDSYIADGLTVGSDKAYIEVLDKGASGTFTVTVEFEDKGYTFENGVLSSANDIAQSEDLKFDLVVYAVQVTTDPTP